jgi:hypothetical protein
MFISQLFQVEKQDTSPISRGFPSRRIAARPLTEYEETSASP